jgi:hypothetical protein
MRDEGATADGRTAADRGVIAAFVYFVVCLGLSPLVCWALAPAFMRLWSPGHPEVALLAACRYGFGAGLALGGVTAVGVSRLNRYLDAVKAGIRNPAASPGDEVARVE